MRLRLKRHTQNQIQEIFKTVSYHPTLNRVESPDIEPYPLADSLLKAYWGNNIPRINRLAGLCETRAKKATNPATLVIHTAQMCTKEGVGGKSGAGWYIWYLTFWEKSFKETTEIPKCKSCKGINNSLTGDYCLGCINEKLGWAERSESVVPQKEVMSHDVPQKAADVPRSLCSICGTKDRASWSNSYCRGCYAAKKKAWRDGRKEAVHL